MKIALWGLWHVHAEGYCKQALAAGAEVVGFYEEDAARRAAFAERHPEIRAFATPEELLASEAEGVLVCTATCDHAAVMVRIAEAGKDIFTEKVVTLTAADALRVKAAVEKAGVRFVISFPHLYQSAVRTAFAEARKGTLGKVNYFRFRNCHSGSTRDWLPEHFYSRAQCGGGAMIDLGAHGMYLAYALLGLPVRCVSAMTVAHRNGKNVDGVEDNAVTVMTYPDGAIAVNETGFVSGASPMTLEIAGEAGSLLWQGEGVVLRLAGEAPRTLEMLPALRDSLTAFLEGEAPEECGMDAAVALTEMMEMAYGK